MKEHIQHDKSLIPLQQSCVQQLTTNTGAKLDWQVFNDDGKEIHSLTGTFNEKQIFDIQKYVKKFELEAFNIGMFHMKALKNKEIQALEEKYKAVISNMRIENDKVSNKLSELIGLSLEDDQDESSKIGIPEHMR